MPAGANRRLLGLLLAGMAGCGPSPAPVTPEPEPELKPEPEPEPETEEVRGEVLNAAAPVPPARASAGLPPLPAPIETRVSSFTIAVYDATERTSEHLRGRIPRKAPFHVYDVIEGPNCHGGQWGQVGREAWVCLRRTEVTDEAPAVLPVLGEDRLVPNLYARPRREYRSDEQTIPRWRSRNSYNAGEPPTEQLPAHGQYAFRRKRFNGGDAVYEDHKRRVIPAKYLWRFKPSEFAGHELSEAPLADDVALAWVIERDGAPLYAAGDDEAEQVGTLDHHAKIHIRAGTDHADEWVEVLDAQGTRLGWARNQQLGVWSPPPPMNDANDDQIWIDVELREQVLTVMRGRTPIFATLISSGKAGHGTPTGTYRVNRKKAYGAMQSQDDEPEPYYVEAVPWSQYYFQGFAIHAAYWHDGFGKRRSHGCVNLSPKDARHVFGLTGPHLEPGWLVAYEHEVDPGTSIRVRRGEDHGTDHRKPIEPPGEDTDADDDDDDGDD